MATIVTRAGKGSPLTNNEMDANLNNLNTDKAELSSLAASSGASLMGFLATGTGAVATTVQEKLRQHVSVKDFGAVGDGVTDDLAAFQAAALAAKAVYIPAGTYIISGTVTLGLNGASWFGDGIEASIVKSSSASAPMFSITGSRNGITIENFQLTRSVTATSGGNGIQCSGVTIGQANIRNMLIEKQWQGLSLGPTDWSEVQRVIVQKCLNTGIYITNTASDGVCQWSMDTVLSQKNVGLGFAVQAIAGPSQITCGTLKNCATFANSGVGVAFLGIPAVPVQGVRIFGGFFGADGNHEIYFDTYGGHHVVDGTFLELAGRTTTGPTLATAASNTGAGIEATGNNTSLRLNGVTSTGHSLDGFYLNATYQNLTGCSATQNGQASTAGRRMGLLSAGGRCIVLGGRFGNTSGTSQTHGAYVSNGNNLSIGFVDLTGNATAAWACDSNVNYVTSMGNLPNTLNVGLSPAGAVLVGGNATGDFSTAGTINTFGGLLKNDVGYTNP